MRPTWAQCLLLAPAAATIALGVACSCLENPDPHWEVVEQAQPSATHPMAGIWKSEPWHTNDRCSVDFAMVISPGTESTYSVALCSSKGCTADDSPPTALTNDPSYQIIDANTMKYKAAGGIWLTLHRCPCVDPKAKLCSAGAAPAGGQ